ncbi:MAG: hypothetical protein CO094_09920 [Anaerolineae bacterium CG_4_9_14_3_um_filter_57_17]|nr:tetratricopeptide repeat protein [bacterium]OIO83616.1 MAG: hypothetical protein AUK01_12090 [Anaerolineae bacterium CG2_30_57_67]PJB65466.1 MAG: hypothetical protein CO094_09920 [Anaerolineae bacterium CG_4_9_14_3_um_filter_57_17]
MFLWTALIMLGIGIILGIDRGDIGLAGAPIATPTRALGSLIAEADTYFTAGKLDDAISAYREATKMDGQVASAWASMARVQVYSSALLATDSEKFQRLQEALQSAEQATKIDPEDSLAAAVHALALDWNAGQYAFTDPEKSSTLLTQAEQEAVRALQLDNTNSLAIIYYAEILIDQQKWERGQQYLSQASEPGAALMDWHRVYAYYLETQGLYLQAIQEYDRAIQLTPNLTFLHLRAGANYRQLAFASTIKNQRNDLYVKSLEYFDRAAKINEQIQVKNPIPYLSIAKTYSQMGEYYAASRNVQKALEFEPTNPDVYGQLGIVYFKSRNYEGSIPAFKCAIRGCSAAESCDARGGCDKGDPGHEIIGMALSPNTLVYYYTYGSVLASLSRPKQNYCSDAFAVFQEIRNSPFGSELGTLGIIQEGEAICRNIGATRTPQASSTSVEETPVP